MQKRWIGLVLKGNPPATRHPASRVQRHLVSHPHRPKARHQQKKGREASEARALLADPQVRLENAIITANIRSKRGRIATLQAEISQLNFSLQN